jgi:hypothetical protein
MGSEDLPQRTLGCHQMKYALQPTLHQTKGEKLCLQLFHGTPRQYRRVLPLIRRVQRELVGPTTAAHEWQ